MTTLKRRVRFINQILPDFLAATASQIEPDLSERKVGHCFVQSAGNKGTNVYKLQGLSVSTPKRAGHPNRAQHVSGPFMCLICKQSN